MPALEVLNSHIELEGRTIVDTINTLNSFRNDAPKLPAVGVLRLGTGNALARWLAAAAPCVT